MSVSRLDEEVDAKELVEWQEYWFQNPEHEERQDRRMAVLQSLLCVLKKDMVPQRHEPIDFMPYSKKPAPELTHEQKVQQAINLFRCFAATQNDSVRRSGEKK